MTIFLRKICIILALILLCGCDAVPRPIDKDAVFQDESEKIFNAFHNHQSNFFVESKGIVIKILPDDLKGSRHQKFILKLNSEQTLLISHNIDIAPRINDLKLGDKISFRGEYIWNDKGGMIHWTHHDPQYRQPGGWLEYESKRYD